MKKEPSLRMKKAIDIMVAHGGNIKKGDAFRQAGYSEAIAKNPHKITRGKTYRDYLDSVGMTSAYLSRKHRQLTNATRLEKDTFHAEAKIEVKRKKEEVVGWVQIPDEKIKLLIEGTEDDPTGNKIAYIKKFEKFKEVFFRVPDSVVQKGALDMAFKVRGDYTADRAFEDLANHIISQEEKEGISDILKENRK